MVSLPYRHYHYGEYAMKTGILSSRIIVACSLLLLTALSPARGTAGETKKLDIVATLFPQYDFAKRIGGDNVSVKLLLPPGADAHAFDPKPSDMVAIARADLFAYTGADMEPWAEELLEALADSGETRAVDVAAGMEFIKNAAAEHDAEEDEDRHDAEHDEAGHDDDDHDDHARDDHDHDHHGHDEHGHGHVHVLDPHVWLDPVLAITMVDNLLRAMCEVDAANAALYTANAAALKDDLKAIDAECRDMVAGAKRRTLVFGGRFAFVYFTRRYGLEHIGAYDSCGAGDEPSIKRIIEITEYVRNNRIPVIYHEEFVEPKISKGIADATGCTMALARSLHNLTADEMAAGAAFVDLMRENVKAFAEGLK